MLLAIDFDKDFIDAKGVAVASVFSLQTASKNGSKFDAPKSDSFAADCDATFSEEIFNEWSGTPTMA
ncbi:MAG: hypothetical protein ACJAXW_003908 [Candidatus Azotimanducaceae bacterium]|jgi:hypothetical protein